MTYYMIHYSHLLRTINSFNIQMIDVSNMSWNDRKNNLFDVTIGNLLKRQLHSICYVLHIKTINANKDKVEE